MGSKKLKSQHILCFRGCFKNYSRHFLEILRDVFGNIKRDISETLRHIFRKFQKNRLRNISRLYIETFFLSFEKISEAVKNFRYAAHNCTSTISAPAARGRPFRFFNCNQFPQTKDGLVLQTPCMQLNILQKEKISNSTFSSSPEKFM